MKTVFRHLIAFSLIAGLQTQAAPVFETAATASGKNSKVTVSKPVGTQTGDLLVAALMFDLGTQIAVSIPDGWTLIRRSDSDRYVGMATYFRIATATDSANYSFPLNKTSSWAASISRISGANTAGPIDTSASATGKIGNVIAASTTTRQNGTLVLAFYTNRRNATYTPAASTTERYDKPNTPNGLPSNMLATFEQTQAGATGNKPAVPSQSERWVGMQISIAGAVAAADLSGFRVSASGSPVAGQAVALQITEAKNTAGNLLNGSVAATVTSSLDALVFDAPVVFTNGTATLPVTLTTAAAHVLTVALASVTDTKSLPLTVNRQPITLTADPKNKLQDNPDPALTYTLTAGSLIKGIPLTGAPARDPGETPGLYTIRQGALTDAANPNYAITFMPANFEIIAPVVVPPPVVVSPGIWISAAELASLPMSGEPWLKLKEDADLYWGIPNLSDQEDKANIYTMSKALVYARTGIESYRTAVIEACMQAIGSEKGGNALALARNLGAFVIAADLVGLPPAEDAVFRAWLETVRFEDMIGKTLVSTHEGRPNNWGAYAGGSRAAVAAYLNDQEDLDRVAQIFKGWLGNRTSYAGFTYGDLSWQSDPAHPVGINPQGATIQGHNVDGVLPEEQRLGGGFVWPAPASDYAYESLQGALLQAVILHRAGYDVWNWENQALLRAFMWQNNAANTPATGDDSWQTFLINYYYNTNFPTPAFSEPGKNVARTCWTHAYVYTPPPVTPPASSPDLTYFPGDYSAGGVLGNSLPGTWRPFSADSPWNTPISAGAVTHPDSGQIMSLITSRISKIRLGSEYLVPVWIVNSDNALPAGTPPNPARPMDLYWVYMNSPNIFDTWDQNKNNISDIPVPMAKGAYPEPTADGHICVIDPFKKVAYEMSRYPGWTNNTPTCTTFNVWDLTGNGVGNPLEGTKWWARGGRGSGFPLIAGLLRPEELLAGEIRHALTFTLSLNRRSDDGTHQMMIRPPACRSDGQSIGTQYPVEGMLFQLDPSLTDADFDSWGLTREGKVLARALQKYGMYLGDIGGDMALQVQLIGSTKTENRAAWDQLVPGFYNAASKIPANLFRVVYTGEPTLR